MSETPTPLPVYLEIGRKRTFAGALDWPGWCRSGRDEGSALQALVGSGDRYARVLRGTRLGFGAPKDAGGLTVVERLAGDPTTDFGAPGRAPAADEAPVSAAELKRFGAILRACWRALDAAAVEAQGRELHTGPRGGGRSLDAIVLHVLNAEAGYLARLGARRRVDEAADRGAEMAAMRSAILESLGRAVREGVPEAGPRGGRRWTPRYFVRRVAWHAVDHAWEIEDRAAPTARTR